MRHPSLRLLVLAAALGCATAPRTHVSWSRPSYPETKRVDVVDTYHGVEVADPYRWLEDPDSPEARAWIEAQNALTRGFLDGIEQREPIRARLTELWNYERFGLPVRRRSRLFLTRNDGLQNQSVLYVHEDGAEAPRVLLDPNTLSSDGTVALSGLSYTQDGRYLAYGLAEAGSDWNTWRIRDVATGEDLPDTLRWIKFSGAAWTADGAGFFYSRYDEPAPGQELAAVNRGQKLFFHRRGTPQAEDELVYARADRDEWSFAPVVTDDGRWLVIVVGEGTDPRRRIFVDDLATEGWTVVELIPEFDAAFQPIESEGERLWLQTDLGAPRGKVVEVDTRRPARSSWNVLVPERAEKLERVTFVGGRFLCRYLRDARSVVRVHEKDGTFVREVELPGLGTASGFGGLRDQRETYYSFTSFTDPGAIWRYDVESGASELFRAPKLAFDPSAYVTEQEFCRSKDGTRIPVFVSRRKDVARGGDVPTLLYGYGGFGVSLTPSFSSFQLLWMESGGAYAVANLRGGGEYGEEWHQAGTKLSKQNVFDDFIAAAEHLCRSGWTRPDRLAIQGGSNGGLLVGAVLNQRPELFGAAIPAVGVMDMLRYEGFTIGWAWASDFGSVKDEAEFRALRAYSPYHNVREGGRYPPVLVMTADHDDRVVPGHSFKYAAALQAAQAADAPILIRIDVRAGHGAGKPTSKLIEQSADELAFLMRALAVEPAP